MDIARGQVLGPDFEGSILPREGLLLLRGLQFSQEKMASFLKAVRKQDFVPKEVVGQAKALHPLLARQFEKDTGNWEKFSLEQHILAVLAQYKKYRDSLEPKKTDQTFFLIFLTFHDIGKPLAVEIGDKGSQHQLSAPVLRNILCALGLSNYVSVSDGLLSGDILGKYIKGECSLEDAIQHITACAKNANYSSKEFYSILKYYYLTDASAYTKNAISNFYETEEAGLGWLFTFDKKGIYFQPKNVKRKMELLDAGF